MYRNLIAALTLIFSPLALSADEPAVGDCEAASNWPGREPAWYADACLGDRPDSGGTVQGIPPSGSTAYMLSFGIFAPANLTGAITYPMPDINSPTQLATSVPALFSADFNQSTGVLYAVNNDDGSIGTVDLSTGVYTSNATLTGISAGTLTGLAWDPTTGVWYLTVGNELYTVDPDTGIATLIGDTGLSILIEIKFDAAGQLYAVDISDDSLYAIDKTTASATLIGPLGFNLNFAQGMAYDYADNTMWAWMYQGGGLVDWGTIDLSTGAATSFVNFTNNGPEAAGAILGGFGGGGIPDIEPVPTLSATGLIVLVLVLAGLGLVVIRLR
ncbi:MAG: hypothetical protein Kow0020_08960 [Wenzhouxiangellaceae bacterium]